MRLVLLSVVVLAGSACSTPEKRPRRDDPGPFLVVLGIAQDGGVPQAGAFDDPRFDERERRRLVSCLGLVDPRSNGRWMFDATPDFRDQLTLLQRAATRPSARSAGLDGIFLTHAHIGHYTGLMFLGHESIGARGVPVHAMPRMKRFLETSGPWSQLVEKRNIAIEALAPGAAVALGDGLMVRPIEVPHRQEFSEVVGFRIEGPKRAALFIPDIDSWEELERSGVAIEALIGGVERAYLDGTFMENGEIPGRDMRGFPHPFIAASIARFAKLPPSERSKIRFIHLNHTNPALDPESEAAARIRTAGHDVATEGERFEL